jgi:hypothetical protein
MRGAGNVNLMSTCRQMSPSTARLRAWMTYSLNIHFVRDFSLRVGRLSLRRNAKARMF